MAKLSCWDLVLIGKEGYLEIMMKEDRLRECALCVEVESCVDDIFAKNYSKKMEA